jgi:Arc/MetJ-type ribon-helix-helix transcriptional regulator
MNRRDSTASIPLFRRRRFPHFAESHQIVIRSCGMVAQKSRLSVTVAKDVLDDVERCLRAGAFRSRSAIVEAALRTWATRQREAEIHAYYDGLSSKEHAEDLDWAKLGSEAMAHARSVPTRTGASRKRRRRDK